MLDQSLLWILTPEFNQSNQGESGKYSSAICLSVRLVVGFYGLFVMGLWLVVVVFRIVGKKKSDQDLDPDKPVCVLSARCN